MKLLFPTVAQKGIALQSEQKSANRKKTKFDGNHPFQ
jgi:hypothetical protein